MTKIYVPITDEEFVRLSQAAFRDCRHPREQARHFIRQALGLGSSNDSQTKSSTAIRQDNHGAAGSVNP